MLPASPKARTFFFIIVAAVSWSANSRTSNTSQTLTFQLARELPAHIPVTHPKLLHDSVHNRERRGSAPRGFTDLVGDRSPLSPDPNLSTESASWMPASRWSDAQNMTAMFPTCEPGECNSILARQTTNAVQAALWASQNPPDCGNARFLVLEKAWQSGFGSAVHIHTRMLALAIRYVALNGQRPVNKNKRHAGLT